MGWYMGSQVQGKPSAITRQKKYIINKAWNLRQIWTFVKELETFWIYTIHHRLSWSLLQNWKSQLWPSFGYTRYLQKLSQPNMERKHRTNSRPVADFGLSARGRYSFEGPDGKSEVFEVGKPIEKHVLVSFLQLHLLHTLRSTSLISNVSLTLKWFKCFFPCH